MNTPIEYIPNFVTNPGAAFALLMTELAWLDVAGNRLEYYSIDQNVPYTYGKGVGVRTYHPQPWHPVMLKIREKLFNETGVDFDVCFLNAYRDGKDQLNWHSDNSPEMSDNDPIAIISLGAKREIYFRPMLDLGSNGGFKASELVVIAPPPVEKLWLEDGSLCLMKPGMQDTHEHRIPKASYDCGPRVSLTFRKYVDVHGS